jgi:outer membrane protein TolC
MKHIILLCIVTGTLYANDFHAFISSALKSSHTLRLSQLNIEQKKATLEYKTLWDNPQIEVAFDDRVDGSLGVNYMEVSQSLPHWGESSATKNHSKASIKKAIYSKKRSKLQISYLAADLYRILYHQKKKLRTLQKQLKEAKRLLAVVKRREESGDVSGIERDRIAIGLYRLNITIEQEKSRYTDLLLKAQTLLKKRKIHINSSIKHKRLKTLNSKKVPSHPHLDTLKADVEAKEYAIDIAKSKANPKAELFVYQEKEGDLLATSNEIHGGGVRINIPLWNQNRETIELQKVEKLKATDRLNYASFKLKEQNKRYLKLYKNIQNQRYRYRTNVLSRSKKLYQLSKTLFESGEKSLLEMLDAQAFYFSSELEYNTLVAYYDELYLKLAQSLSINLLKASHE